MLFLWVPITIGLFLRLRPGTAAGVSLLGAFLLLPVGIGPDLPGLPPLVRNRIALLAVLLGTLVLHPQSLRRLLRHRAMVGLAAVALVTPLLSAITNRDAYFDLHAMTLYDGYMVAMGQALDLVIPFLLGLALIHRREDLQMLLVLLAGSALLYSLPVLFEVRMAPVLHREIYGYLPHGSWGQAKRFGGWRPMVFTPHGLTLARYLLMGLLATAILHRVRRPVLGLSAVVATLYLMIVLILAKSLGAIIFAAPLLPLVLVLPARRLATLTILLGVIVFSYPVSRALDVFPTDMLVGAAESIDSERSQSLNYRFFNEDMLLEHALAKPLFGWGGWGRNRVYDPDTKELLSTAVDGYWIIVFGYQGIVGFVSTFGMLLIGPLLMAWRIRRVRSSQAQLEVVGLALIVVVYAADLLPNGFPMTFMAFVAGGLAGGLPRSSPQRRRRAGPNRQGAGDPPPREAVQAESSGSRPGSLSDLLGPRRSGPTGKR